MTTSATVCPDCGKPTPTGGWVDHLGRTHHVGCGDVLGVDAKEWHDIPDGHRVRTLDSVKRSIKAGLKRHRRGRMTQQQCDEWASDCALWFVHQLMFSDGERHIVESPDAAMFRNMAN